MELQSIVLVSFSNDRKLEEKVDVSLHFALLYSKTRSPYPALSDSSRKCVVAVYFASWQLIAHLLMQKRNSLRSVETAI